VAAPTVSLILPAFNEERRIPRLLEALRSGARSALEAAGLELVQVVIVDDGSTDGTLELIRRESRSDPRLHVVALPRNRGKGGAVAEGVKAATGELSLIADVDLSTPLTEVGKLYGPLLDGADIAIGSRTLDPEIVRRSAYRFWLGRGYNLLVRVLTGLPYRDTQCGFKLAPTELALALLEGQLIERYAFDVETLVRARVAGYSVVEVPVVWIEDPDSSVGLRTAWRMAIDTIWLTWRLRVQDDQHRTVPAAAAAPVPDLPPPQETPLASATDRPSRG
jgi:dolichyl-phosphate beta-glucosyltransferase